ncbi:MAG: hypothetical protein ACRC7G_16495 [Beijerinckiaceae bacterium]
MRLDKQSLLRATAATALAALLPTGGTAARTHPSRILVDGITASWSHEIEQLVVEFSAPTAGWLAIGFNSERELRGTRFFMVLVSATPLLIEEHVALVPEHRTVAAAGLQATQCKAEGSFANGRSRLSLTVPPAIPGRSDIRLHKGERTHLMLAWSHDPDFRHHSAWRRHFDISL